MTDFAAGRDIVLQRNPAGEWDVLLEGRFIGTVWSDRNYWYADQGLDWANRSINGAPDKQAAISFLVQYSDKVK